MYQEKKLTETNLHAIHWKLTQDCKPAAVAVVQSPSGSRSFATPQTAARQASPAPTISWSLPKFMSIALMMPSNHLILCHLFLLLSSIFPASGSFPMSQFFASGGQSIGVSALASVLPKNIQDWFPLGSVAYGILIPWPGVKPMSFALGF